MWTTNGIGFPRGPSPQNRQPMRHVKVLSEGSTRRVDGQVTRSRAARRLTTIRFIPLVHVRVFADLLSEALPVVYAARSGNTYGARESRHAERLAGAA
jgi:hypothetical protein